MLSTALAGCAHRPADIGPAPTVVAVKVADTPDADLLICPTAPDGFPLDVWATMPPAVRSAAIRLAEAYAATRTQLERLIGWENPPGCAAVSPVPVPVGIEKP